MLRPFAHPVACCWMLLRVVAQSLKPVKLLAPCKRTQHCWLTTPNIVGNCCARLLLALTNRIRISGRRFSPAENNVCEPERQNDFCDVELFLANHSLALKIKELIRETPRKIVRDGYVYKSKLKGRRSLCTHGRPFSSERRVYES